MNSREFRLNLAIVVGRFTHQIWMSVQIIGGNLQQVLDANQGVSRLEFLRIRQNSKHQILIIK
ncbi:MAG: hypothetical protein R3C49_16375 [Planctomycetaceae bacterium]